MILHCVFCNISRDIPTTQRNNLFVELADFSVALDGVLGFDFGPNRDFENKSQEFSDGFVIRFTDRESLSKYAGHPTHQRLGARLCELCVGGADGIVVFDLEIS